MNTHQAVEIESGLREYLNSREGEQSQAENDGDLPTPEAQEDCPLIKTAQSLKKIVSMTTSVASIVSELQVCSLNSHTEWYPLVSEIQQMI